ncbi:5657_t:CDS:2, partial [Gigaspora rosea]
DFVIRLCQKNDYLLEMIANMDETLVWFDIAIGLTINPKGPCNSRTILVFDSFKAYIKAGLRLSFIQEIPIWLLFLGLTRNKDHLIYITNDNESDEGKIEDFDDEEESNEDNKNKEFDEIDEVEESDKNEKSDKNEESDKNKESNKNEKSNKNNESDGD